MTPEEKLVSDVRRIATNCTPCESVELWRALEEYESAPKPWAPPWPMKIPDWDEVWLAVDKNGVGFFYNSEPSSREKVWIGEDEYGFYSRACSFEIPPGMDWRQMKVRVR